MKTIRRPLTTEEKQVINQAILNKIITTYPEELHVSVYNCVKDNNRSKTCREQIINETMHKIVERCETREGNAKKIAQSIKRMGYDRLK